MDDPHDLQRFVDAQSDSYEAACDELRAGRKRSHWMWFVFPQLRGLGTSAMALRYGIASVDEARAYLAHRLLGPRLQQCTRLAMAIEERSLVDIFGATDALKFRSCMTLFGHVAAGGMFADALRHFDTAPDPETMRRLVALPPP